MRSWVAFKQKCHGLCSPQSMGISVQLNQDLASGLRPRWGDERNTKINGKSLLGKVRVFRSNFSKKEIPTAWHTGGSNHTETRSGFHLITSRQNQRKIRGRSAMSPSASSSFPSFRSCLCRYTWQCSNRWGSLYNLPIYQPAAATLPSRLEASALEDVEWCIDPKNHLLNSWNQRKFVRVTMQQNKYPPSFHYIMQICIQVCTYYTQWIKWLICLIKPKLH